MARGVASGLIWGLVLAAGGLALLSQMAPLPKEELSAPAAGPSPITPPNPAPATPPAPSQEASAKPTPPASPATQSPAASAEAPAPDLPSPATATQSPATVPSPGSADQQPQQQSQAASPPDPLSPPTSAQQDGLESPSSSDGRSTATSSPAIPQNPPPAPLSTAPTSPQLPATLPPPAPVQPGLAQPGLAQPAPSSSASPSPNIPRGSGGVKPPAPATGPQAGAALPERDATESALDLPPPEAKGQTTSAPQPAAAATKDPVTKDPATKDPATKDPVTKDPAPEVPGPRDVLLLADPGDGGAASLPQIDSGATIAQVPMIPPALASGGLGKDLAPMAALALPPLPLQVLPAPAEPAPKADAGPKSPAEAAAVPLSPAGAGEMAEALPKAIGNDPAASAPEPTAPETSGAAHLLPQIGVAGTPPETAGEGEKLSPVTAFARPFDGGEGKPLFAILLQDIGAQGMRREDLAALPFPVTFVIDPLAPDAAEAARIYRAAGQEVLLRAKDLPFGATAGDLEQSFQTLAGIVPEAVGVIDAEDKGFQDNRPLASLVLPVIAGQGRGLVTYDRGLNAADQIARREGLPAATIFRRLDGAGESQPTMRRYLDRAAFKAAQVGAVVVIGETKAATVATLLQWAIEGKGATVALAPITAVMARH